MTSSEPLEVALAASVVSGRFMKSCLFFDLELSSECVIPSLSKHISSEAQVSFWVLWVFFGLSVIRLCLTFLFLCPHLPALHPAFEEFATSLVKQEMTNMPRGVYHSALREGTTRSDQGKTVAGVPNFLLKMYERNKQPGMTPGLAGKLSLSRSWLGQAYSMLG